MNHEHDLCTSLTYVHHQSACISSRIFIFIFSKISLFVFSVLIHQLGKKHRIFGCRLFGSLQLNDFILRRRFLRWWRHFTVIHQLFRPLRSLAAGGLGDFCGSFHGKVTRRPPSSPTQLLRDFEGISIPSPVKLYIQLGRSTRGLGR